VNGNSLSFVEDRKWMSGIDRLDDRLEVCRPRLTWTKSGSLIGRLVQINWSNACNSHFVLDCDVEAQQWCTPDTGAEVLSRTLCTAAK
jgi:hypothetical protein